MNDDAFDYFDVVIVSTHVIDNRPAYVTTHVRLADARAANDDEFNPKEYA